MSRSRSLALSERLLDPLPFWGLLSAVGMLWSLLSWSLSADGHHPSGPPIWQDTYGTQALYLPLWLPFSCWAGGRVAAGLAGAGAPEGHREGESLALLMGGMLGGGIVIPDLIVYHSLGFESLGALLLWSGPLTLLILWLGGAWMLKREARGWLRALAASLGGLLCLGILLGLLVR